MIQANELRINNWISHNNNYVQVFELPYLIDLDENKEAYLVNSIWIDEYRPIPLTPEILEKCGFENNHDDYYADALMLKPKGNVWEVWLYPVPKPQSLYNATNIIFLHQLQNLYFALTGEELTFKL